MNNSSEIIIYKTTEIISPKLDLKSELHIWKPSIKSLIPDRKPLKYILYWFYHYFGIFKNKKYCYVVLIENNIEVASMLVIPAHYKYPFMDNKDVQFTYVMTNKRFRGKGYAWKMIYETSKILDLPFWYITNQDNLPSKKLANKMGFKAVNTAEKKGLLKIIKPKTE